MLDLTEENFFDLVLDPDGRRRLHAAMRAERRSPSHPLSRRYDDLTHTIADADRLGRAVSHLLDTTRAPEWNEAGLDDPDPAELEEAVAVAFDDRVLFDLLVNPHTPEEALWEAYRRGRGIDALGHRRGPRALLEALAEEHRYSEAITTLALSYYADEDDAAFRRFVERHRGDFMLRWNLRRGSQISEAKRALVADLLEEE